MKEFSLVFLYSVKFTKNGLRFSFQEHFQQVQTDIIANWADALFNID